MLAALAQRRPGGVALASAAGLLLLALPLLGANFANSDARALPASAEARQAHEALERDFPAAAAVPVTVLVRAGADSEAMLAYLNALNQHAGVAKLELRTDIPPGSTVIDLYPHGDADGPRVTCPRRGHPGHGRAGAGLGGRACGRAGGLPGVVGRPGSRSWSSRSWRRARSCCCS